MTLYIDSLFNLNLIFFSFLKEYLKLSAEGKNTHILNYKIGKKKKSTWTENHNKTQSLDKTDRSDC